MIPGTLLGALFLAACLVPGFIFVRVAEQRQSRPARSTLFEAVELAGVGAAASLVAGTVVLFGVRELNVIETTKLAAEPGNYLLVHPVRGLWSVLVSFGLSCLIAWLAARVVFRARRSVFEPGGTAWGRVFHDDRPSDEHEILVTVELRDGRFTSGMLRTFSPEFEDAREIARPAARQFLLTS